jgi:hypothetical protein
MRINPRTDAEYTHNVPFLMAAGAGAIQTDIGTLAANVSAYNFGCNIELGGGPGELFSATHPAIGIRLESNYITGRRQISGNTINERFQEFHLTHTPSHNSSNTTAGQHIRFMSVEVGTGFDVNTGTQVLPTYINGYFSIGAVDFRLPQSGSQGPIYFSAAPGNFSFSTSAGVGVDSFNISHNATITQFGCTASLVFVSPAQCNSHLTVLNYISCQNNIGATGTISSASTSGNAIAADNGGIFARKAVATGTAAIIYAHAAQGSPTSEPAAVGDAVVLFTRINGSSYELWAKFQNTTVKKLADDT